MGDWKKNLKKVGKGLCILVGAIIVATSLGTTLLQELMIGLACEFAGYCLTKEGINRRCVIAGVALVGVIGGCGLIKKFTSDESKLSTEESKEEYIEPIIQELTQFSELPDRDEIRTSVAVSTPEQIEEEIQQGNTHMPEVQEDDLQELLVFQTNFRSEIECSDEYMEKAVGFLKEQLERFMGTVPNCSAEEMNGNVELCQYLQKSHEINRDIRIGRTVGKYENLMELYEAAYELAKSSVISLQLARPYAEIVEIYPRDSVANCSRAFKYGMRGIECYLETLSYETISNESVGDVLYRIGQVYHYLGDMPYWDLELRTELYITAVAYLELAGQYPVDSYYGYSDYYAGMVCHKLGIVCKEWGPFFLERAASRYQRAIEDQGRFSKTLLTDVHHFKGDVYDRLAVDIEKHKSMGVSHTPAEYRAMADKERMMASAMRAA